MWGEVQSSDVGSGPSPGLHLLSPAHSPVRALCQERSTPLHGWKGAPMSSKGSWKQQPVMRLILKRGNYRHPGGPKYSSSGRAAQATSCFPLQ